MRWLSAVSESSGPSDLSRSDQRAAIERVGDRQLPSIDGDARDPMERDRQTRMAGPQRFHLNSECLARRRVGGDVPSQSRQLGRQLIERGSGFRRSAGAGSLLDGKGAREHLARLRVLPKAVVQASRHVEHAGLRERMALQLLRARRRALNQPLGGERIDPAPPPGSLVSNRPIKNAVTASDSRDAAAARSR